MKEIARGAEAVIYRENDSVIKDRIKKGYRILELDDSLRKGRTMHEAKILKKLFDMKNASVPELLEQTNSTITMSFIDGQPLKRVLEDAPNLAFKLGAAIAELHDKNIIHGDLTTNNILVKGEELFIIDFGLSFFSAKIEDKAVDIHVLKQTLKSNHPKTWLNAYQQFLKGYASSNDYEEIIERLKNVEKRGRYKKKTR